MAIDCQRVRITSNSLGFETISLRRFPLTRRCARGSFVEICALSLDRKYPVHSVHRIGLRRSHARKPKEQGEYNNSHAPITRTECNTSRNETSSSPQGQIECQKTASLIFSFMKVPYPTQKPAHTIWFDVLKTTLSQCKLLDLDAVRYTPRSILKTLSAKASLLQSKTSWITLFIHNKSPEFRRTQWAHNAVLAI